MLLPIALALGASLILPAGAAGVPDLKVEQVCTGIAKQGGASFHDPAIAQQKKQCLESEEAVRQDLVKRWSSFPAADRSHCVDESATGGDSSYTELLTCLEMARDVRTMRGAQEQEASGALTSPAFAGSSVSSERSERSAHPSGKKRRVVRRWVRHRAAPTWWRCRALPRQCPTRAYCYWYQS